MRTLEDHTEGFRKSAPYQEWKRLLHHFYVPFPTVEHYENGDRMKFGKTTPVLRIFDEAKAKEFYVGYLGFKVDWEHRLEAALPLYMQVSRDQCVLHLSEHHGDCSPGAAMRIETGDLEAFHKDLAAKNYKYARPAIEATPWGSRDLSVCDPFGNRLTFTNAVSTTAAPPG